MLRSLFVTALLLYFLPLMVITPFVGVLAYTLLDYFAPDRLAWGFVANMSWAMIMGAGTVILWLFRERKVMPPLTLVLLLMGAFFIWINLTTLSAQADPAFVLKKWDLAVKVTGFAIFSTLLINSRVRIEALIWILVLSVGFHAAHGAVVTLLTGGGGLKVTGPPGAFLEPRAVFSVVMLMMIPLARYLYLHSTLLPRTPLIRAGIAGLMVAFVIAVVGTQARTGLVTGAVVALLFVLRSKRRLAGLAGIAAAGLLVLAVAPGAWYERMATLEEYEEDGSAMGRIDAWEFAIETANEHPLTGGGFRIFRLNMRPEANRWADAHSIYFETLGEHGYVGLGLYLLMMLEFLRNCRRIGRLTKDAPEFAWAHDLARSLPVSLAAFAVGGAFVNMAVHPPFFSLLVIVIGTRAVVERALTKEPAQAETPLIGAAAFDRRPSLP